MSYTLQSKRTGQPLCAVPSDAAEVLKDLIPELARLFDDGRIAEVGGDALAAVHVALTAALMEWQEAGWDRRDTPRSAGRSFWMAEVARRIYAAAEEIHRAITDAIDPEDEDDAVVVVARGGGLAT